MKLRRWLNLGCLLLVTLIAGCGDRGDSASTGANSADPTGSSSSPKKLRVALIMKSLANEFFSTMAEGAQAHQARHQQDYELLVNGIKDERDLSRQVGLVEEMMAVAVDAIVIAPADSKALVPVLRKALEQGIAVVNIDNRLDADVLKKEGATIPFVGPDNRLGAKKVAGLLCGYLQSGDEVLILEGIRTSFNAQQRLLGFQEALSESGVKIADSQSADWEMSRANTIAAAMLSEHPRIKAILAANDSMALGALAALKSAGRDDIRIVGFDNISAIQQAIRESKVLATVDQHGDQLAVFGIQAALEMIRSGSAQTAMDTETPIDLITIDSLSSASTAKSN